MRKAAIILGWITNLLTIAAVAILFSEARYESERFAAFLIAVAAAATFAALFRQVWPSRVSRLKDELLAAELKRERGELERGAAASAATRTRWGLLRASGKRTMLAVALAVSAFVIVVAFVEFGIRDGSIRISNDRLLQVLFFSGIPGLVLVWIWRTDEVTRLAGSLAEVELQARLRSIDPSRAVAPVAEMQLTVGADLGVPLTAVGAVEAAVALPSVGAGGVPSGASACDGVKVAKGEPGSSGPRLWPLTLGILLFNGLIAKSAPGNGARLFGAGLGMVFGGATVSLLFAAVFMFVARRVLKFDITYRRSFFAYFYGGLLGMGLPFVVDAYTAASLWYPTEFVWAYIASTAFAPPIAWVFAQDRNGQQFGIKRSLLMWLFLAPLGAGFGYAWVRLFS